MHYIYLIAYARVLLNICQSFTGMWIRQTGWCIAHTDTKKNLLMSSSQFKPAIRTKLLIIHLTWLLFLYTLQSRQLRASGPVVVDWTLIMARSYHYRFISWYNTSNKWCVLHHVYMWAHLTNNNKPGGGAHIAYSPPRTAFCTILILGRCLARH